MANKDEVYILNIVKTIPGVEARLATPEEDRGRQKADIVVSYMGDTIFKYLVNLNQKRAKN